ncbi:MAG: amino acid adenylation domain-containing protein [Desulfuromonadales bacterium]
MNKKIVHSVFEHIAAAYPDNNAVEESCGASVTYGDLNRQANILGSLLTARGIGRDRLAGVLLPAGIGYTAAILGVLKSGGLFMPLEPGQPRPRLLHILVHTTPSVIVTNQAFLPELQDMLEEFGLAEKTRVLVMEYPATSPAPNPLPEGGGVLFYDIAYSAGQWLRTLVPVTSDASNLPLISDPDDSCYVIYTSGSTGVPKFIEGWHKGLAHYCHWQASEFGLNETSRISQMAPVTFEASLKDYFVALCCGATLCIPTAGVKENPARLIEWIESSELTLFQTVPSYLRLVMREVAAQGEICRFPKLKLLFQSGDTLYGKDINQWRQIIGRHVELVNLYGPAEVTLLKSFYRIPPDELKPNEIVPIGKPISNTVILIMNGNILCPPGKIGEICVKSPFIVKGYYRSPELTAGKFVQNPINPETRDIIYRTGDLGRYRTDMVIEFVGRMDSQVKVHGNRIELAEIEQVLLSFPRLSQAIVVPHRTDEMENVLACYYTEQEPLSQAELRELILSRLPDYMVPAYFIRMDQLPLSLNGKVDRKALPKPEELVISSYEELTTVTEQGLAEIWSEVLGLARVGACNPFIEIGGDSLKAIRVIARIYKQFGVEVSVRDFFACPTIRELARFVDAGRPRIFQNIPVVAEADSYELSHAQRRLWLLDQMDKDTAAYIIASSFLIEGAFHHDAFVKAVQTMYQRHETLRTTFSAIDGVPRQYVRPITVPGITRHDLSAHPDPERKAREFFQAEWTRPFTLDRVPLFRISVLHLGRERTVLILVIHHIISDVWSLGVMTAELSQLYNGFVKGEHPQLSPLPIQYRDFAAWQNSILAADVIQADRTYWLKQLAGTLPPLDLPADFPRPPVKTYAGAVVRIPLESTLANQLRAVAAGQGASLFALLLALVRVLVFRYTGQEDLVIGTPVAGRTHPDLESQIGFFLNTLALRDQVRGDDCFSALLARVMATNTAAFDHQGYPFDRLVDDLELPRDVSRSPVFDLMVVLQNAGQVPFTLDGAAIREFDHPEGISKFDLDFVFQEMGEEFEVLLEYNLDLFLPERIKLMARHFLVLAEGVAANPDCLIRELPLLSPPELAWIHGDFNATAAGWPKDATLVSLFEQQAARTPERIAVTFQGESLSYAGLNGEADRIAALIRGRGIGPGGIVALISEPSMLMPAQLLGILKAGCAYLPIDPAYPEERIRFMLDDSGAGLLLESVHDSLPPGRGETGGRGDTSPAPADAAYIIYTSGSTGKPKGVVVEHRNVVRLLFNDRLQFEFSENDVWIQSHSFCFDFSVWEMYGALLRGGRLVIPRREEVRDIARYAAIVRDEGVTVLNQTPAAFYGFIEEALPQNHDWSTHLRYVIFGGDRLEPSRLRSWSVKFPDVALINMYGITETTVHVTYHHLTIDELAGGGRSPIGRPVPDTTVYVCDAAMNLMPAGVPGEMYVGGSGVSRGYLNRPELTEERFVDNPFQAGERLYRTGDLGRWNWSGGLEYLGRNDHQVQIRGFRVEPGEIESRLLEHPAVKECTVQALEGERETLALAAWIVFAHEVSVTALREHLAVKLADYMIPSWFTPLDMLPLTANGKLDRKALPDPRNEQLHGLDLGTGYVAPRTELEQIVATVWEGVLGRSQVGIHDNYFALGGDSIRAIQVGSRLQQHGLKVEMLDIFQFPTVAGLAGRVTKLTRVADQRAVSGAIPLTPVQRWFFEQQTKGIHHYNQSILLGSEERLDEQALRSLFESLVFHHDALRIRFTCGEAGWRQENLSEVPAPRFETVDLSGSADPCAALERHAASLQAGFDPAVPPLVACALYRLPDGDRLLIVIHHLVVDGISWRILAEDLLSGYARLTAGEQLAFPCKSDSFKRWSERLCEYAAGEALLKEQEYWQDIARIDAAPLPLLIAPDQRKGRVADFDGIQRELSAEETLQLLNQANQAYHTDTSDLLLTSLALALQEWTGSRRHLITLEGHGREDIGTDQDISRTVGWFTTLYPHLLEISERDDPGYRLRVIKEAVRAVPKHGLGYGVLRWLTPDNLKQGCELPQLPRISFNYLGTFDADFGSGPFFPATEQHGDSAGEEIETAFDLELTCSVMGGKLSVNLHHDRRLIETGRANQLAASLLEHLRKLIAHCCQVEDAVITPSDISYDGLDIDQLDALLEGLGYDN